MRSVASLLFLLPCAAAGQDLMELLARGPVVLVETDDAGRLSQATAVQLVEAPVERVWAVATDFGRFREFMPKTLRSDAAPVAGSPGQVDVTYEVEVPGPNPVYTLRYAPDEARREIPCRWVRGDLQGSHCRFRLVAQGRRTLLYYTTLSRNYSSLAQSLEDEGQTVTVGVNVSAALAVVNAVRRRAEGAAK